MYHAMWRSSINHLHPAFNLMLLYILYWPRTQYGAVEKWMCHTHRVSLDDMLSVYVIFCPAYMTLSAHRLLVHDTLEARKRSWPEDVYGKWSNDMSIGDENMMILVHCWFKFCHVVYNISQIVTVVHWLDFSSAIQILFELKIVMGIIW